MAVRLQPAGNLVVVTLSGLNRIFALKGRLDVPRSQITSIEVMPRGAVPPTPGTWLRAPGTYVPGLIRYGSYGRTPNREFWAVFRHSEVIVIGVTDWTYSRLVIGTSDPHGAAALLQRRR